jgi:4-aminobutyrate aminotransferase
LNSSLPKILMPLPGPKTQALIDKDHQYLSPSYTRDYPLSIAKGEGAIVEDLDGNRFLDFCSGIAVCSTGHSHPNVVQAIQEQAADFLHMSGTDFYYSVMATLAERLAILSPGNNHKRVYFGNSGAEVIEASIKLARYYTGRSTIVSFFRSFHGRTYGAMSATNSKSIQKKGFGPLVPGFVTAHYPYYYRDPFKSCCPEAMADACLEYIENYLFKMVVSPEEVAAFLVEPIQGEGGYVVPPANFLPRLQELAHRHGILIIADEVQSGIGRTGKMWASQHFQNFDPDILVSAKGLASGLPLGAMITKHHLMTWKPGAHASTFGGNPVACAAALATLELVENELCNNATVQGQFLQHGLQTLLEKYDILGEIRGLGLMIGIEVIESKTTRQKAPAYRNALVQKCFEHGLLILGCGENSIRFCPPLIISAEQAACALHIFEKAIQEIIAR